MDPRCAQREHDFDVLRASGSGGTSYRRDQEPGRRRSAARVPRGLVDPEADRSRAWDAAEVRGEMPEHRSEA
jgi:hypothetical protein